MFTVYVLRGSTGKLYKGMTNDLERRLREHASGHTQTTRSMGTLEVIYQEQYATVTEARAREVYLKTAAGRRFLRTILGH